MPKRFSEVERIQLKRLNAFKHLIGKHGENSRMVQRLLKTDTKDDLVLKETEEMARRIKNGQLPQKRPTNIIVVNKDGI